MQPLVTGEGYLGSQPYALRDRMVKAGAKHDEHLVVNLRAVRTESLVVGQLGVAKRAQLFFCNSKLEVVSRDDGGDEQPLPGRVELVGFDGVEIPADEIVDMLNVGLYVNGVITVSWLQESSVVPSESEVAVYAS